MTQPQENQPPTDDERAVLDDAETRTAVEQAQIETERRPRRQLVAETEELSDPGYRADAYERNDPKAFHIDDYDA